MMHLNYETLLVYRLSHTKCALYFPMSDHSLKPRVRMADVMVHRVNLVAGDVLIPQVWHLARISTKNSMRSD